MSGDTVVPAETHEWVSFDDPGEQRTWMFDVTFLLSRWECIYGRGCQGVLTGPAPEMEQGCCSYGAHFTDDADVARVKRAARTLKAAEWQFHREGRRAGVVTTEADGTRISRLVDDACIFLNRPGFSGGAGCALHLAATERQVPPLRFKPDVCWQLPLRREDHQSDDGHVTSVIRQWDRRDWGEGGQDFHWWCTEAPEAFTGSTPVYQELHHELQALVGTTVHGLFLQAMAARQPQGGSGSSPGEAGGRKPKSGRSIPVSPTARLAVVPLHPAVKDP